jgi:hypothetical protein
VIESSLGNNSPIIYLDTISTVHDEVTNDVIESILFI